MAKSRPSSGSQCGYGVGDKVRVRDSVRDPQYGWGDVEWGDVGSVVCIKNDICLVSFPTHFAGFPLWKGAVSELQYVEDVGMFSGLIDVNQRLFASRSPDDCIVIAASDGMEYAHKCVLAAASDVFAGMFATNMREGLTGRLELRSLRRAVLTVFLRLLYTGLTDPEDWSGDAPGEELPLDMLLAVTGLARKYMVVHVFDAATEALKLRLYKAAAEGKLSDFQEIWKHAIAGSLDAVRMAAVQMVKDTVSPDEDDDCDERDDDNPTEVWGMRVKKKYEERALCPEIVFELQVLWPPPARARKYRRLV